MVGRAESQLVKKYQKHYQNESNKNLAASLYNTHSESDSSTRLEHGKKLYSYRSIAEELGVARETIRRRCKGGRSKLERGKDERVIKPEECSSTP